MKNIQNIKNINLNINNHIFINKMHLNNTYSTF